jgi:hypothetical protein
MGYAAHDGQGPGPRGWQPDMDTGAYPVIGGYTGNALSRQGLPDLLDIRAPRDPCDAGAAQPELDVAEPEGDENR